MKNALKTKVLLVDDHRIFLDGLQLLMSMSEDIEVLGSMESAEEALDWLPLHSVDVVITDLNMPGMGGVRFIQEIKLRFPALKCIALTMLDDYLSINETLDAGVDGYLLKNTSGTELILALHHVMNDKPYMSPEINMLLVQNLKQVEQQLITPREKEVLKLIVAGYSSKQIAAELDLSLDTIKFHRKNLLSKLNQPNVAALVNHAHKLGLNE